MFKGYFQFILSDNCWITGLKNQEWQFPASPIIQPGGPGPANNQALYYSILQYQKTDSLDLKKMLKRLFKQMKEDKHFFDNYN